MSTNCQTVDRFIWKTYLQCFNALDPQMNKAFQWLIPNMQQCSLVPLSFTQWWTILKKNPCDILQNFVSFLFLSRYIYKLIIVWDHIYFSHMQAENGTF